MDKQTEKNKVSEAEKFLQELLDQNSLNLKEVQELIKKLQKVNSDAQKKKDENKKALADFVSNKQKIKEYLEKDEYNTVILSKAAQKILSKNQPKKEQDTTNENKTSKASNCLFQVKSKNLIEIFNKEGEKYFTENCDNLFIYFESLTRDKLEQNELPLYTMIYFPKEKKVIFYLKSREKLEMSFSQVDYLLNSGSNLFLNIDYFSMIENCEMDKGREYKKNILDMEKLEKCIKEIALFKENEIRIVHLENDGKGFKKEFCQSCNNWKEKVKEIITNNKDFLNDLFN